MASNYKSDSSKVQGSQAQWYHGIMSRKDAEAKLQKAGKVGSFLIRRSPRKPGEDFVVSCLLKDGPLHADGVSISSDGLWIYGDEKKEEVLDALSYQGIKVTPLIVNGKEDVPPLPSDGDTDSSDVEHSRRVSPQIHLLSNCVTEELRFHHLHGKNATITNNGRTASRPNARGEYNDAIIMSNRALQDNELFEVVIEKMVDRWSGSIEAGLTAIRPDDLEFPNTMTDIDHDTWMLSGSVVTQDGGTIRKGYQLDLDTLTGGSRLGMMRTSNGEMHFFLNGVDQGVACSDVPPGIYAVVDLYGQCAQVSITSGSENSLINWDLQQLKFTSPPGSNNDMSSPGKPVGWGAVMAELKDKDHKDHDKSTELWDVPQSTSNSRLGIGPMSSTHPISLWDELKGKLRVTGLAEETDSEDGPESLFSDSSSDEGKLSVAGVAEETDSEDEPESLDSDTSSDEESSESSTKKTCPHWSICKEYMDSLDVDDHYLNPKYDMCYCVKCHDKRGDDDVYTRGEPPMTYALPIGWCRFSLSVPPKALAQNVFEKWHVGFHGTDPTAVDSILRCGELLIPGDIAIGGKKLSEKEGHFGDVWKPKGFDTKQIFLSPSIKYSGCDVYAKPETFKAANGKAYKARVAFQVCIRPESYNIGPETIGSTEKNIRIDRHFDNDEIEWFTKERGSTILYGLLINMEEAPEPFLVTCIKKVINQTNN